LGPPQKEFAMTSCQYINTAH